SYLTTAFALTSNCIGTVDDLSKDSSCALALNEKANTTNVKQNLKGICRKFS
ncbi:MAG: hypothetical protein ACI902_002109, partial [Psychroserpens sp.]